MLKIFRDRIRDRISKGHQVTTAHGRCETVGQRIRGFPNRVLGAQVARERRLDRLS